MYRVLRHSRGGQYVCPTCNEPVNLETAKTLGASETNKVYAGGHRQPPKTCFLRRVRTHINKRFHSGYLASDFERN